MDNSSKRTASSAEAVLSFLRNQGILAENSTLSEETIREAQEKKQKQAYHNTLLLLSNYRNILWQTDCEIEAILVSNEQRVEYGQPLFRVKRL